jgi:D-alanyl-D-alanine carboxypeptidase-like protein
MKLLLLVGGIFLSLFGHPAREVVDEGATRFDGSIQVIDKSTRARMIGSSWHPGCPVAIRDLRLLEVSYWGFDRQVHEGRLIVHEGEAAAARGVMRALFDARFPIRRMRLVDDYGGSDERSMAANNTSAFNCRGVAGSGSWSQHSYGRAVDVNPVQNPEIRSGVASPAAGRRYTDRSLPRRGMIRRGGPVVRAFAAVGWSWGGDWHSLKDYQHFSANGR